MFVIGCDGENTACRVDLGCRHGPFDVRNFRDGNNIGRGVGPIRSGYAQFV